MNGRVEVEVSFVEDGCPDRETFTADRVSAKIHREGSGRVGRIKLVNGRNSEGRRVGWKLYAQVISVTLFLPEGGGDV